ncbi:hypothetical protein ACP70R_008768 [Stipagrostis hirtigluma subsp. patula]
MGPARRCLLHRLAPPLRATSDRSCRCCSTTPRIPSSLRSHLSLPHTSFAVVAAPGQPSKVTASTAAWVDGIICDIASSRGATVSIAQLICNAQEIIHPYNASAVASLLVELGTHIGTSTQRIAAYLAEAMKVGERRRKKEISKF